MCLEPFQSNQLPIIKTSTHAAVSDMRDTMDHRLLIGPIEILIPTQRRCLFLAGGKPLLYTHARDHHDPCRVIRTISNAFCSPVPNNDLRSNDMFEIISFQSLGIAAREYRVVHSIGRSITLVDGWTKPCDDCLMRVVRFVHKLC